MNELFSKRLQLHQKQMMKYLRYVFNDHFVLICTFLAGGLGLYYSNALKALPEHPSFLFSWLILLVWLLILHVGRFVSLTKPADLVFLLPKENQMKNYLQQALRYSCYLPFVLIALVLGITMPLAVVTTDLEFSHYIWLLPTLWALKVAHLQWQRYGLFFESQSKKKSSYAVWLIASFGVLAVSLYLSPIIGLILGVATAVVSWQVLWQRPALTLQWEKMIQLEKNRLHRIYQFINLFTDVPEITASVKRRKYLDGLLERIPKKQSNTYFYLFVRRMVRGSEYSGLYLRLVLLGGVLLYFSEERWFSLGIGGLFLYLIGFQLVPLYNQFRYMVLTHLYPVKKEQQKTALQKLLAILLAVAAILFAAVAGIQLNEWSDRLIVWLGYGVIVVLFILFYLPARLKKIDE